MSDRERARFAAGESAVAAVLGIGGFFAAGASGFLSTFGVVLIVFAVMALGQALAVGFGLYLRPYLREREDSDASSDRAS